MRVGESTSLNRALHIGRRNICQRQARNGNVSHESPTATASCSQLKLLISVRKVFQSNVCQDLHWRKRSAPVRTRIPNVRICFEVSDLRETFGEGKAWASE